MDIACSSITWGPLRRAGDGPYAGVAGLERILDEIRAAGYSHAVASVRGRAPGGAEADESPLATPQGQLDLLARHGLRAAPGSIGGLPLGDPEQAGACAAAAGEAARYTRGLGLDAVYLMPESAPSRRETPGHYPAGNRPDRQSPERVAATCATLNRMGEACRAEGVWLSLHNHAGMFWETGDEFDEVIDGTDPALVALGPDVGHMVWGGTDPVPWFRRHMDRVRSIHIKDVDGTVLHRVRQEGLSYGAASDAGIWTEIGSGAVDWPGLFALWREAGYDGAVVVESDRTLLPTPAESVARSRAYLRDTIGT
jgi:inosose dehydratase